MQSRRHFVIPDLDLSEEQRILDDIRLLFQALRLFSTETEKRFGLSAAQFFVLQTLRESPSSTLNELALKTATHQSSVSVVVRKLSTKGLVEKVVCERDARCTRIVLTSRGSQVLKRSPMSFQDRLLKALQGLSSKDRKNIADNLDRLVTEAGFASKSDRVPLFFESERKK